MKLDHSEPAHSSIKIKQQKLYYFAKTNYFQVLP